eukprot:180514-Prorocentrum_minimum.AAC.2
MAVCQQGIYVEYSVEYSKCRARAATPAARCAETNPASPARAQSFEWGGGGTAAPKGQELCVNTVETSAGGRVTTLVSIQGASRSVSQPPYSHLSGRAHTHSGECHRARCMPVYH